MAGRVYPIHADAHALPYAEGFFDAIVSVDAYHYFGLEDGFLDDFSKLVGGDRAYKLSAGTTSEPGRYVKFLGGARDG